MVKQVSLAADIAEMLGELAVSEPSKQHLIDGIAPKVVAAPADYDEVRRLLAYANERGLAVIPLGGCLHSVLGNVPARYDIALEMRRITGIVEFEPADLTITVRAGTTLGELRRLTETQKMLVPFDPSIPDRSTVGGVLAANISGPGRLSLGQPRDFTIGMRVVTADGRLSRAGGRVVKNVAGYDMCKLYIGSLGTLAVIVEATFKTVPLPRKRLSLSFNFVEPESACRLLRDVVKRGLKLESAVVFRETDGWRMLVDLAGTPEAVARSEFDVAAAASAVGGRQIAHASRSSDPGTLVARLETFPAKLHTLLLEATAMLPGAQIEAQPWDGVCRIGADSDDALSAIQHLAAGQEASLVVERCSPEVKRQVDVFGELPSSFPLMQSIKREFDRNGSLSPGRFVGRL